MDYELAKQLKDAGFPQNGAGKYRTEKMQSVYDNGIGNNPRYSARTYDEKLYIPTLEELIEACGDKLFALFRKGPTVWVADGGEWIGGYFGNEYCIQGKTPSEAVARLWLALNKNSK